MKLIQVDLSKPTIVQATGAPAGGRHVKVVQTATPGNELHKAVDGQDSWDVVTVEVVNTSNAGVLLTIEFGGTTVDDKITVTIPANTTATAPTVVVNQRWVNSGITIRAFAASANVINCYVGVMRYGKAS